jgi:hypothetical protein
MVNTAAAQSSTIKVLRITEFPPFRGMQPGRDRARPVGRFRSFAACRWFVSGLVFGGESGFPAVAPGTIGNAGVSKCIGTPDDPH